MLLQLAYLGVTNALAMLRLLRMSDGDKDAEVALGDALGVLHAYNVIAFASDRQGITVHRPVQNVLRIWTVEPRTYPPGRQEAEQAIQQACPAEDSTATEQTAQWEPLLPHVFALAESTPPTSPASAQAADTYHAAAQHLHRQGRDAYPSPCAQPSSPSPRRRWVTPTPTP